jgi:hypothetical protein
MGRNSLPDAGSGEPAGSARGLGGSAEPGRADPAVRGARGLARRPAVIAGAVALVLAAGAAVSAGSGLLPFGASCAESAIRLDLVASPEIAPAIREVADHARVRPVRSDGHCMDIRVTGRPNHEVASEFGRGGGTEIDIWLPDSASWTDRAQYSGRGPALTPAGTVAVSPVALATLPKAATALGWPGRVHTWSGLTAAAIASDTVRLGTADPAVSATGLLALAGVSDSLGRAHSHDSDTRIAATARLLARRVAGNDTRTAAALSEEARGGHRAVFLSEQAAYSHNTRSGKGLRLFYPSDGTPRLDYPYHLVGERRMSVDKSRAAVRFLALLGDEDSLATLMSYGFRPPDGAVPDTLVRMAGGRPPQPAAQAAQGALRLPSDVLQEALGLWTVTVRGTRLTAVVDVSGSMATRLPGREARTRLTATGDALRRTAEQLTAEDEFGLWEFATNLDGQADHRVLVPTAPLGAQEAGPSSQRDRLTRALQGLGPSPRGATGLHDSVLAAYRKAQDDYAPGKLNAVVLVTDGVNQDRFSITRSELVARLEELARPGDRPVALIAVSTGPESDPEDLEGIARVTGGAGYHVTDPSELQPVLMKAIVAVGQSGGFAVRER